MSHPYQNREDTPDPPVPLPGIITRLAIQSKTSDRVSVFVDHQFLIGVPQKAILELHLEKGKNVDNQLYRQLCDIDRQSKLEFYFLSLLARRLYAKSELTQKGLKKGYSRHLIQSILEKFENKGWIDDAEFAESFARDKYNLNHWGPNKIRSALYSKNIEPRHIEKAVEKLLNESFDDDILEKLVLKKKSFFLREENLLKRKKKILDFLLRKGFSSDKIYKQLDHFLTLLDE